MIILYILGYIFLIIISTIQLNIIFPKDKFQEDYIIPSILACWIIVPIALLFGGIFFIFKAILYISEYFVNILNSKL